MAPSKCASFPTRSLGPDEDVLEQARAGAPVAVIVDGGRLAVFQNEFGILGAPFLASGYDGIRKVVTSDMFDGWVTSLPTAPACRSCPSTGGRANAIF
jgi:TRAP-type C4-dicarboxylate transport system substrate-binding protein